ncbi:HlyD family secretion protein [Thermus scotoductus]|uniref:HlyD family secretion protein n=1 Tax=Thermus scotoductus TaxID=37636 RepID=UPI001C129DE5|nr:HlyD family secretion protein [Thermus scotoductus]
MASRRREGQAETRLRESPSLNHLLSPPFDASTHLPVLPQVHPIVIPDLPSLSGLLVRPGDRVEEGEPLARYVDEAPLEELAERAGAKQEEASRLEADLARLEGRFRLEREVLEGELARAREARDRLRYLAAQGAEPRLKLLEAEARVEELLARRKRLVLDYTGERAHLAAWR